MTTVVPKNPLSLVTVAKRCDNLGETRGFTVGLLRLRAFQNYANKDYFAGLPKNQLNAVEKTSIVLY